jgi:endonuclease/exonuclease/phosphatase family metal-dependent hydrolase
MKQLLLLLAFFPALSALSAQEPINVLTFNIRFPNPGDGIHYWENRKERVAQTIQFHDVSLFGVQEAFRSQLDYLEGALEDYTWFGVCRTDGTANPDPDNEFSAVFYKKSRFEQLDGGTFWLSETPDVPGSKGWDAALPRIVTWVKLRHLPDGTVFYFFNTHFDHMGKEARINSARLLRNKISELAQGFPVLCTGDFNADPATEIYQTMTAKDYPLPLQDAFHLSQLPHFGPKSTFTGSFTLPEQDNRRIDYIFVNPNVEVLKHAILGEAVEGKTASDHLAVFAQIKIKP